MSYVVTDNCIRCKFKDCVTVCPVDCFHEGENMLVINPNECIDCGVCEPECPAAAISPQSATEPKWLELNQRMSALWPVITEKGYPPEDAEAWMSVSDKLETVFSAAPAKEQL